MENQHRKITGYRELSQDEIDLMNEIKAEGERLEALVKKIHAHIRAQSHALPKNAGLVADNSPEFQSLLKAAPASWADGGMRNLQTGLMFLTRAVAQPTTF